MKRLSVSLFFILLIPVLIALSKPKPIQAPPETSPSIENLLATARSEASKHFNIAETQLVLFAFSVDYGRDWLSNNSTNGISGYHVQFFDPATVEPDENHPGHITAVNLSIMLDKEGRYRNRSAGTGRGIGWTTSQSPMNPTKANKSPEAAGVEPVSQP